MLQNHPVPQPTRLNSIQINLELIPKDNFNSGQYYLIYKKNNFVFYSSEKNNFSTPESDFCSGNFFFHFNRNEIDCVILRILVFIFTLQQFNKF